MTNLLLMALVLLFLSINVGTAPHEYPISNQINSQALQTNFKLETNLEDGLSNQFENQVIITGSQGSYLSNQINSHALQTNFKLETNLEDGFSNQFGNQVIITGSQRNYLIKQTIIKQTLRPASQINQFICVKLTSFIFHESKKVICPPCIGQRRFNKQFIPIDHQRFGTISHKNETHIPSYELRKKSKALRGRKLSTNNKMTEHAQTGLVGTCGNMERLLMMESFQVTVQQSYQPAEYLRDCIRLVMDPTWDEAPQHLVTLVRSDGLSAMKVLQVLPLHRERQRILCPLGVSYAIGQVSLMQRAAGAFIFPQ
jgi:hypothetical protein